MLNSKSDFVSMNDPARPVRIILNNFVVNPRDIPVEQDPNVAIRTNRPQLITFAIFIALLNVAIRISKKFGDGQK